MTNYQTQMLALTRDLLSAIESNSLRDAVQTLNAMRQLVQEEDEHRGLIASLDTDYEPIPGPRFSPLYGINEDRTLGEVAPDSAGFGEWLETQ